jgi:hypothetical protein
METPRQPDELQPMLQNIETALEQQLGEVCDSQDVSKETTGELVRLEEALLSAAKMAKDTIALRRRRRAGKRKGAPHGGDAPAAVATSLEAPVPGDVRTFESEGQVWRVWEVRPGVGRPVKDAERTLLGEYQSGWLVFETPEGTRRRYPNHPVDWMHRSDDELRDMLSRATEARRRQS